MKIKLQVCLNCGFEEKVKLFNREEAERERLNLVQPCCKKCGSFKVRLD